MKQINKIRELAREVKKQINDDFRVYSGENETSSAMEDIITIINNLEEKGE